MLKSGKREGPLFYNNGVWPKYRQISYFYTRALKMSGLPFTATHILRHAALSEAYESCKDINSVKVLAGHSSINTTQIYAKARTHQVDETQKVMNSRLELAYDCSHLFPNDKSLKSDIS